MKLLKLPPALANNTAALVLPAPLLLFINEQSLAVTFLLINEARKTAGHTPSARPVQLL